MGLSLIDNQYSQLNFSNFGEDLVIMAILSTHKRLKSGFYVDVGCHHPFKGSNTALLHYLGWHGINIDASKQSIDLFDQIRPKDINLRMAISDVDEIMDFYSFKNRPAINTLKKEMRDMQVSDNGISPDEISVEAVSTCTLSSILDLYLLEKNEIDFLNIDIEGFDFKALRGLNIEKYKPYIIAIEDFGFDSSAPQKSNIWTYLNSYGYKMVSRCYVTSIFRRM